RLGQLDLDMRMPKSFAGLRIVHGGCHGTIEPRHSRRRQPSWPEQAEGGAHIHSPKSLLLNRGQARQLAEALLSEKRNWPQGSCRNVGKCERRADDAELDAP